MSDTFKYAVIYTDGGNRTQEETAVTGGGVGIHGYFFNELDSVRYAGVPVLITPLGYKDKPTGPQLKDESYNPTWEKWGYSKTLKEDKVVTGSKCVTILDAWMGGQYTAQRAEVLAFITAIKRLPLKADKYFILADSQYVVAGINRDLVNWKAKGWRKSDNSEVSHRDLWEEIDQIVTELGDRLSIAYVKAHNDDYGNESADRNATFGLIESINSKGAEVPLTVKITTVDDGDYWEGAKTIPHELRSKWCYSFTGHDRRRSIIDGKEFYHYFVGDHSKNKDDVELLGNIISDAGFGLVLYNDRVPAIESLEAYHREHMWDGVAESYRYDVVNMINVSNVNLPKVIWELMYGTAKTMWIKNQLNDIMTRRDELISKVLRPPLLSYRYMEEETRLREVLLHYIKSKGSALDPESEKCLNPLEFHVDDVTELFYETSVKKNGEAGATKMTNFYDNVAKSITMEVTNPITKKRYKKIFARGIELPNRNLMAGLVDYNPKVKVISWPFGGDNAFWTALIIETDRSYSIWCGCYRQRRLLAH